MLLLTFASALGLGKAGIQQSGELSRLQLDVRVSWIKKNITTQVSKFTSIAIFYTRISSNVWVGIFKADAKMNTMKTINT